MKLYHFIRSGITAKIGYLKDLGVSSIWLNPIYKSPQKDNGYDVQDYRMIDEMFGTMADFDELITELHNEGNLFVCSILCFESPIDRF